MAVPKFKTSKKRTRRRRSINMKQTMPHMISCNNCGNKMIRHRICPKCGFYRGQQILEIEAMA